MDMYSILSVSIILIPYLISNIIIVPIIHTYQKLFLLFSSMKVDCPRMCAITDVSYSISPCRYGKLRINYLWNATTIANQVDSSSHNMTLPEQHVCGSRFLIIIYYACQHCLFRQLRYSSFAWQYNFIFEVTVILLLFLSFSSAFIHSSPILYFLVLSSLIPCPFTAMCSWRSIPITSCIWWNPLWRCKYRHSSIINFIVIQYIWWYEIHIQDDRDRFRFIIRHHHLIIERRIPHSRVSFPPYSEQHQ